MSLLLCLIALAACERDRGERSARAWVAGEGFVAEDAGMIPLTSPGTAPRMERDTIGLPMVPFDEIPAPAPEEPFPEQPDEPITGEPRLETPERQQRTIDTMRPAPTPPPSVPLVVPPPEPRTPPRTDTSTAVPTPAPPPPPAPVPAPEDEEAPAEGASDRSGAQSGVGSDLDPDALDGT